MENKAYFKMREGSACPKCRRTEGYIKEKGFQDCVYCGYCHAWVYNAPRSETGKESRSAVPKDRKGIHSKKRWAILERAGQVCEGCRVSGAPLIVGHILSVDEGRKQGVPDKELNDMANLMALCHECNIGMGSLSATPYFYACLLTARASRGFKGDKANWVDDPNLLGEDHVEN